MTGQTPRVLDVGNCDPDHAAIRGLLRHFNAQVDRVMFVPEALKALERERYDLVLVNRLVFADSSEGIELIKAMQADERFKQTPVIMISNFPEAQQRAVAAGAVPGFGKSALRGPATLELLKQYLSGDRAASLDGQA